LTPAVGDHVTTINTAM